ncbi:MAG: SNF2-related protein, partial [Elainellaceae cyanobacterium]
MENKDEILRSTLSESYYKLASVEQKVVQLMSICCGPVQISSLLNCCKRAGISSGEAAIKKLLALNLILKPQNKMVQCNELIVEIATRHAVSQSHFQKYAQVVEQVFPVRARWKGGPVYFNNREQFFRQFRIFLYRHDIKGLLQAFQSFSWYVYHRESVTLDELIFGIVTNPFDSEWVKTLPRALKELVLSSVLNHSLMNLLPSNEAFELLRSQYEAAEWKSHNDGLSAIDALFAEQLLLRNQVSTAHRFLDREISKPEGTLSEWLISLSWLSFVEGDLDAAGQYGQTAVKTLKKETKSRQAYFGTLAGLFFVLTLIKAGGRDRLQQAERHAVIIMQQSDHWLSTIYERLYYVLRLLQGDLTYRQNVIDASIRSIEKSHAIETLFCSLCLYWVDPDIAKKRLPKVLKPLYAQSKAAGLDWLALESGDLLARLSPRSQAAKDFETLTQDKPATSVIDIIEPKDTWEICLDALVNLQPEPTSSTSGRAAPRRLAWFLTFYPSAGWVLQPREQKINAQGNWSKGRPIALKRLAQELHSFDYLTPQDTQICACIESDHSYSYGSPQLTFGDRALLALVGHSFIFWEDAPTTRVEMVKGEPELRVSQGKGDRLVLSFLPSLQDNDSSIFLVKETPTRMKVVEVKEEHLNIARIIGSKNHLEVPASAQERVMAAINAVSGIVTVHSDIGGTVQSAEEVKADPIPHAHLLPAGEGLKVALLVRPFATGGAYYRPGMGGAMVVAEIDGKRLQTTRDLDEEKTLATEVMNNCPTLTRLPDQDGEWLIDEPEDCLELLIELQEGGDRLRVEWPEGQRFRVSSPTGSSQFSMNIRQQQDWFAATGELRIDDQQVLDMKHLMELLEKSPGRFIPLGDGQFIALTQEFRKRLDDMRAFSENSKNGLKFHPLAALAFEDWTDEVGKLKTDRHWKDHIKRLQEMKSLNPKLPSTLQAELRDYQMDGFQWLARLAHWGVGACLADDMGLGKTLQAIALILTRAPQGPTLIVAPTSVCMNWISEAEKFAPTLRPVQLDKGDRQETLENLQPFDMVVCSYGLLQQEDVAKLLAKVEWQTVVLDEAQAIKNMATKRSKAAMSLQSGFKLLTTGTPIENNLSELWNLFRFINPGLLGSLERFNQNFAVPIERNKDKQARNQLRKLIQPFILRRTKSQVLDELPSRTEVTLHVELSQDEKAFYEALRREAIAKLSDSDAAAGQKHLQVLAEIMRLRRACCNPRLVMPDADLDSSKLGVFRDVLEDLLNNNH